jgi:four helix bundle protein
MKEYKGYRDLIVFQKSYKLAMEIHEITKSFPIDEKYSLTDQIRRSSKSVPVNISSAWVRRKYPKHFVTKLLDSLEEESETEVWLSFSHDCKYINNEQYTSLSEKYDEIARMLSSMINSPDKFCK